MHRLSPGWHTKDSAFCGGLAVLLVLAGCGGPTTVITGLVTLDGQPVPRAALEFCPTSGKGRVSFTKTDDAGRYRVSVSPTEMSVVITATKIDGQEENPYDSEGPLVDRVVNYLPKLYGYEEKTPLRADPVENQTTTIDFALTSSALP
jgi:FlaG/FlaF family flagellin (archaellin)